MYLELLLYICSKNVSVSSLVVGRMLRKLEVISFTHFILLVFICAAFGSLFRLRERRVTTMVKSPFPVSNQVQSPLV